jgi:hypothetical protein
VANRQKGDSYDLELPDTGIIIYHVNDSRLSKLYGGTKKPYYDSDTFDETRKLVDVECADSKTSHFRNADDLDNITFYIGDQMFGGNYGDEDDLWDVNEYVFHDNSKPCKSSWYEDSNSRVVIGVMSKSNSTMKVWFSIDGTMPE